MTIPPIALVATDDTSVTLAHARTHGGVRYPRTGEPGKISLVDDWDMIRAHAAARRKPVLSATVRELKAAGATTCSAVDAEQRLPDRDGPRGCISFGFVDEKLKLTRALNLPTMAGSEPDHDEAAALIVDDARHHPRVLSGVSAGS